MSNDELKLYSVPDETDNQVVTPQDVQSAVAQSQQTQDVGQQVLAGGSYQSSNFLTGTAGFQILPNGNVEFNNGNFRGDITGATGTFSGTVTVGSLNIPDSTTASSMHVDSSGNTWWGANVATGISGATAAITAAGAGTFKNVYMGGANIQYIATDNGIFSFGDGSDGVATLDGSATPSGTTKSGSDYTMTRDVYWTNATMSTGTTLNPAGYRIFGTGTLTMNGTAIIKRNGNNGSNGSDNGGVKGDGGAALADGYLKGSAAGGDGGNGGIAGGTRTGIAGASTTNSIGTSGSGGGGGGAGSGQAGQAAGGGGTATASNVKLIANWHLATLLDIGSTGSTVKFDNSGAAGGGGSGGNGNSNEGGAGGGGGSAGGIIAIYFRIITIGASASLTANGGNGGNGGNAQAASNAGGGGGAGGANGGQIILAYNQLTNSGTLTCTKGTKGTGGAKNGTGVAGSNGTDGTNGTIRQFQLSQ